MVLVGLLSFYSQTFKQRLWATGFLDKDNRFKITRFEVNIPKKSSQSEFPSITGINKK
jgi:hypothetical protein